jgi:DNA-binding transcriptional LysR family regulator
MKTSFHLFEMPARGRRGGKPEMKQSFKIFLLTAEEMSISRAAKRAYVTQQCVSDHIKRLEDEYGVALFERKPRLRLTEAGETMLRSLRSVHILENNMERNIREIADGQRGSFTVGMSTSRAQIILPLMLKRYYEHFPKVDVSFYVNDTVVLEEKLLDGTIDLFLGANASLNPVFHTMPLAVDRMYLIISESLLQQHFGSREIKEFEQGADLARFSDVPFSLYYETGAVNLIVQQHLKDYGIYLKNTPYHISDCDTHIFLCASGLCAALIPEMLSLRIYEHNAKCDPDKYIHIFPVKNFHYPLRIELIWHKDTQQPFYIKAFCEMLQEEVNKLVKNHE